VTVLEAARPLGRDDPECVDIVLDRLEREGVVVRSGVNVVGVTHVGGTVTATIEAAGAEQTITGSHLLIAVRRQPAIDGLNLDAAGIRHDQSGIVVDRKLKTTNRRVYAIGDCVAGHSPLANAANIKPARSFAMRCSACLCASTTLRFPGRPIRNRNSPRPASPKRRQLV